MQRPWLMGFEDCRNAGGQPFMTGSISDVTSNTSPIQSSIKEERIEAMSKLFRNHKRSNCMFSLCETGKTFQFEIYVLY